jgi:hypothetical protein
MAAFKLKIIERDKEVVIQSKDEEIKALMKKVSELETTIRTMKESASSKATPPSSALSGSLPSTAGAGIMLIPSSAGPFSVAAQTTDKEIPKEIPEETSLAPMERQ